MPYRNMIILLIFVSSFLSSDASCNKTRELQREMGNTTALGYYEVKCLDSDPTKYEKKQCWASTGRCWCVDKYGKTIPGSQVNPGQPPIDCEAFGWCKSRIKALNMEVGEGPILGRPSPTCDENGNFARSQSWGSTGEKWCAVENGNVVPGTKTSPGFPAVDCDNLPACLKEEYGLAHLTVDGMYPLGLNRPECDPKGLFKKLQCHGSTGECWCVNPQDGTEIKGTRKGPGEGAVNCEKQEFGEYNEDTATSCERLRYRQRGFLKSSKTSIIGFFVVSCEKDGSFTPAQCHPSSGHCWCVDGDGMEQPGTITPPGQPRVPCLRSELTCTDKKKQIDSRNKKYNFVGMYSPTCNDKGEFQAKQCWKSTGQCWCVTRDGKEIALTRRGPADKPEELTCSGVAPSIIETVGARLLEDTENSEDSRSSGKINSLLSEKNSGETAESAMKAGTKSTLIAVIAILSCILVIMSVGGFVYIRRQNTRPKYTVVDANNL